MIDYIGVFYQVCYILLASNLLVKKPVKGFYRYAFFLGFCFIIGQLLSWFVAGIVILSLCMVVIRKHGNSWMQSILSVTLSMLFLILIQTIFFMFAVFRNIPSTGSFLTLFSTILMTVIAYTSIYSLRTLYRKYESRLQKVYRSLYFKSSLIFFMLGLVLVYVYGHFGHLLTFNGMIPEVMFLILYVMLLTLAMLSIAYAGIHAAKKKEKEKQYLELEGYTNHLEGIHKNISGFKHDYVNILSSLMGYIESEDYKGLKNHLTHVISPYSQQIMEENESFSALMMVNIPSLKGLLTVKLLEIYRLELKHNVEIVDPIETIHMDLVDLSRMFGILMDNAIEAASLTQEKYLGVALVKTHEGVTIIVENACPEDMLPIHAMYEEKKTTKGPSRGLGLYHYKEMAKTYKNVLTETLIENKVFKQVLTIHNL